jgi:hypothetical protein
MSKWKQIGGDITWEKYGVVLAESDPAARQVRLVRIVPWMEHDREAAVTHGLYLVDEKTVDIDDLGLDRRNVREAIRSAGLGADEWRDLAPEYQAEIVAAHEGYEESRSVDRLVEALPARPEEIDFQGQKETTEALKSYDEEMRREALEANFDTRLSFGKIPPLDAVTFALGGEAFEMNLEGRDALAFEYATNVAGVSGDVSSPDSFVETIKALAEAPHPEDLDDPTDSRIEEILGQWEARYGDADDEEEEEGIADAAGRIASDMLGAIGFQWV